MGNGLTKAAARNANRADHQIERMVSQTPFAAAKSRWYNMRIESDTQPCDIMGICEMPDGTMPVIDRGNKKLKRLDSSYNVVDHCELSGEPDNICCTGPTEVAIILNSTHVIGSNIQFVSVTSSLTPTRSFQVFRACIGIAYSRDQLFITCNTMGIGTSKKSFGEVRVYNTDGKLLHFLPHKTNRPTPVWIYPLNIGVSPDGSKVVVTDLGSPKYGLVVMNRDDGSIVSTDPLRADAMCVHPSLWLISRNKQMTIFQIKDGGSIMICNVFLGLKRKRILTQNPMAISFQRDSNKLVLGFSTCDYIKVFQIAMQVL